MSHWLDSTDRAEDASSSRPRNSVASSASLILNVGTSGAGSSCNFAWMRSVSAISAAIPSGSGGFASIASIWSKMPSATGGFSGIDGIARPGSSTPPSVIVSVASSVSWSKGPMSSLG